MQQNIYEALDWLSGRVKMKCLASLAGRTPGWLNTYHRRQPVNGKPSTFSPQQVAIIQEAWNQLAEQISLRAFIQLPAKEQHQNWQHINELFISKFFHTVLSCDKRYFENRCRTDHAMPWTPDEILRMNAAIQATAQQMRQIELVI